MVGESVSLPSPHRLLLALKVGPQAQGCRRHEKGRQGSETPGASKGPEPADGFSSARGDPQDCEPIIRLRATEHGHLLEQQEA